MRTCIKCGRTFTWVDQCIQHEKACGLPSVTLPSPRDDNALSMPFALTPAQFPCNDGDEQYTPAWLLNAVDAARPIDIDPCSDPGRGTPATTHIVGRDGADGLATPWTGHVWLNPPYSDLTTWLNKARRELDLGRCELITALIPYRPEGFWDGTVWHPDNVIGHFHRRITFENPRGTPASGTARFPSALVVMATDNNKAQLHAWMITDGLPATRESGITWCNLTPGLN